MEIYLIIRRTTWINCETWKPSQPDVIIGYSESSAEALKTVNKKNKKAVHCRYYKKKVKKIVNIGS